MNDKFVQRVQEICDQVKCPPYEWAVTTCDGDCVFVAAACYRKDAITGEYGWGYSSKYWVDPQSSDDVIARRLFVAARDYAEHEVREGWTYRDKPVLGPHIPLDVLHQVLDV